ncbi:hypothetical protein B0H19DRAFT_165188 [Mycena capillaripes]|nr:hypothetical protein B0H19DRAFT_165188 [Mycena capillaripes]
MRKLLLFARPNGPNTPGPHLGPENQRGPIYPETIRNPRKQHANLLTVRRF